MFEKFFGLTENPFNLTPDPKYLYLSEIHKEAIAHLRYGISERKGFVLLTGEVGAGKTTVCRAMLGAMSSETRTALIFNPTLTDIELLQSINQDFGLSAAEKSKKALLDELNAFLLKVRQESGNAVLVIDECQNLTPEVLEQIRLLSNLETEKEKLLQIIMIGQPELNTVLAAPSLRQINDRIVLRYHMGLLSRADTRDYITHRLMVAGSHGDIKFTAPAVSIIYAYSKGLPRRINAAAERCLLIAFLKGRHTIDRRIAREALKELKGEHHAAPVYKRYAMSLAALCLVLMAGLALLRFDFFGLVGEREGMAKIAEHAQPKHEFIIRRDDWTISDYIAAQNLLLQLPVMKSTDAVLNLHPAPECLKDIGRPLIASINGGYCVVHHAGADSIWVTGRDRAVIEMPLSRFAGVYRWNIFVRYRKGAPEQIYRMADTGERVRWIQSVLKRAGYMKMDPSGVYGVETAAGIEKLQEAFGLSRDGVVGSETLALINVIGRGKP